MAKPTHIQMPTRISMNVLRGHSVIHDCGSRPIAPSPALRVPRAGLKSYMKFQMTPAATKLMASGMKTMALTTVS